MEKECNFITFDGIEYTEVDRINDNGNKYVMLVNLDDSKDFFIKKLILVDGEDYIKGLDNANEFDRVFRLFTAKHIN